MEHAQEKLHFYWCPLCLIHLAGNPTLSQYIILETLHLIKPYQHIAKRDAANYDQGEDSHLISALLRKSSGLNCPHCRIDTPNISGMLVLGLAGICAEYLFEYAVH